MFCTACGNEIPGDAAYCSNCGRAVPMSSAASPSRVVSAPGGGPVWTGAVATAGGAALVPSPLVSDGMATLGGVRYELAGFWVRFGAVLIDAVVQIIIGAIIAVVLTLALADWELYDATGNGDGAFARGRAAAQLTVWLAGIAYYWWGYARGATLGKQALGLRIVRGDGSRPGVGTGFARLVGTWVSGIAFGLGYLWVAWDSKKQAWHDKMANTYVVRGR